MAQSAYKGKTRPQIGPFHLMYGTPTMKFYRDDKLIVVSIRGTEDGNGNDMKADALAIMGKLGDSSRFQSDLEILKSVQEKFPPNEYRYIGVAHSLGAAILDKFLRMGLIKNGLSYNGLAEPQELKGNPLHRRVYHKDDPLYSIFGKYIPNIEVVTTDEPIWKFYVKHYLPFGLGKLFTAYDRHKIRSFKGGNSIIFEDELKEYDMSPKSYLSIIRKKAKEYGYNPKSVSFADDGVHKLEITTPEGKKVKFGRVGYKDFLIYSFLERKKEVTEGTAHKKQDRFLKSHSAIKGDWKNNDYSPNWLSIRLLW